jgi:pyruvate-formate lyase
MSRTDVLRDRALYNSQHKNLGLSELLRYRGLLETESESIHPVKRAKVIRYFLSHYPVEIEDGELLIARHATGEFDDAQNEELARARDYIGRAGMLFGAVSAATGHRVIDYEKVLRLGIAGILEEIGEKEKEISHTCPDAIRRMHFYEACRISLEGMLQYAANCKNALAAKCASERSPVRKAEYARLADIFSQIPYHQARNFYEALQCVWFL